VSFQGTPLSLPPLALEPQRGGDGKEGTGCVGGTGLRGTEQESERKAYKLIENH